MRGDGFLRGRPRFPKPEIQILKIGSKWAISRDYGVAVTSVGASGKGKSEKSERGSSWSDRVWSIEGHSTR